MRIVGAGFTRGEYLTGSGGQQLALRVSWGGTGWGPQITVLGGLCAPGRVEGIVPFSHTLFFHADRTVVITLKNRGLALHADWRDLIPPKSKAELGQMGVIKALESAWVRKTG
ncbi:hypothetical protein ACFTAO_45645 [Paenibacillus rhizoplanae]